MAREYACATTAAAVSAAWAAASVLGPGDASAFTLGPVSRAQVGSRPEGALQGAAGGRAAAHAAPAATGLLGYGACFGAAAALVRSAGSRASRRRTATRAAEIAVAEKTETKPSSYLASIPRSIVDKATLERMLAQVPKEQWEDPPEDSYLYTLKMYAETYGEGKATKMGWWDYWYLRINMPDEEDLGSPEAIEAYDQYLETMLSGKCPMWVPGPSGAFYTGALIQWRGKEMFAGDQVQTPVTNGGFAKQYLNNLAFYREGLKPWQRGLEIGMAHGYFIIGPFVVLGPLRNTPEAATVGLLAGCAVIGIVSVGGLLFGATIKPTLFDKEGDEPGAGYQEMINWHAVGGLGGAGFAHLLITVFGS